MTRHDDQNDLPTAVSHGGARTRLLLIVAALVGLAVSVGVIAVLEIRDVDTTYNTVVQRDARLVKDVLEMKSALADQVIGVRGFIISRGNVAFLEPYYRGSMAFERELADARTKAVSPEDGALLDRVEGDYGRLRPIYEREIALVQRGHNDAAVALVNGQGKAVKDRAVASLEELFRRQEKDLYTTAAAAKATAERSVIELVVLVGAVVCLGLLLAFLVWRFASKLVRQASENRELAAVDALTGLANHRRFHERLGEEFARARRHGRALSLVLFDLDHFKEVNDLHGHQTGDVVLRETAARLRGHAREGDLVARVGGEEFAWLMPETDAAAAAEVAERARAVISREPFSGVGSLTVSAGVCDITWADAPGDLFRLADGALYWSKSHGRDTSTSYTPDVVRELSLEQHAARIERDRAVTAIVALARAVDAKDPRTGKHSQEVADLAAEIAMTLKWPRERVARLREAALVHDVGKVGTPDDLLDKSSELSDDERRQVEAHANLGALIVKDALDDEQVSWVKSHHEWFDGTGYPEGISGAAIPEGARILAVADAWEVMTSERPYAARRTPREALEECRRFAGSQFCPEVVAALENLLRDNAADGVDVITRQSRTAPGPAAPGGGAIAPA